jgi:hypothetical protein
VRIVLLVCAALIPAAALAAVTYSFDWYCPGCAKLGMATNGREGPYGSGPACEGARTSMSGSLASRGCGGGRCFTAQPCVASGQADLPPPPAFSSLGRAVAETAKIPPYFDASPDRVRRADEVKPVEKAPGQSVYGRWRNAFSRYQVVALKDAIQIDLVETCRTPDCLHREYPNRPVFLGRLEGDRLVGVVPVRRAIESEQNGKHCGTPAGEFPVEGRLSGDGNSIVWRNASLPVAEGCAPVSISLGTWRRG